MNTVLRARTTAITFDEAVAIVRDSDSSRLAELARSTLQEEEYSLQMQKVKLKYVSVTDYLLITKFLLPAMTDKDGRLGAVQPTSFTPPMDEIQGLLSHTEFTANVLIPNDHPYNFTPDVHHYVLWKWSSGQAQTKGSAALSESEIQAAEDKLHSIWGGDKGEDVAICRFTNPPALKSIPSMEHVHLLIRAPTQVHMQAKLDMGIDAESNTSTGTSTLAIAAHHQELVIPPSIEGIKLAAEKLKGGQLVAFPTETVYGLGANALEESAVLSIFTAKGRPLTDPLIVHVHEASAATRLVDLSTAEQEMFSRLGDQFWPGPLTLIVKASKLIPLSITAQTGFVGIRVPAHELAKDLLRMANIPIAAPSANRFGHVSPTRCSHVLADLGDKGVHVINGECNDTDREMGESAPRSWSSCEHGIESTVLRIDGKNKRLLVFRQGAVSLAQLQSVCRDWVVEVRQRHVKMDAEVDIGTKAKANQATLEAEDEDEGEATRTSGQEAPGQAITHYAPDVPCYMVKSRTSTPVQCAPQEDADGETTEVLTLSRERLLTTVIVDYGATLVADKECALAYRDLSAGASPKEAAAQLFDALRWAELQQGAELVLVTAPPTENSGNLILLGGLWDRIHRAASGKLVRIRVTR